MAKIFNLILFCWRKTPFLKQILVSYLFTYLLNYYLLNGDESFSRSWLIFSQSRNSPHFMEPEGSYCIHKCPPPVLILSQINPVHTPTFHFLKIKLNIILPSTPGSSKWSLSLRFPHQNPVYASPLSHTRYMPRPSHYSWFYRPNKIWWAVQIIKQYRSLSSADH